MKKAVVLFTSMALLFAAGCSNNEKSASSKAESSTSLKKSKEEKKALENVKMDVDGLFLDTAYKKIDPTISVTTINRVKKEVSALKGVNSQRSSLLAYVQRAENGLASAKVSSKKLASTERNESAAAASSKAEVSSKNAESKAAESSSKPKSEAKKTSKAEKLNSDYPPISSKFSLSHLSSYSSNELFGKQVRAAGTVVSLGADNFHKYHILLKIDGSNAKLLIVGGKKITGKIIENDSLTVYGTTNGKGSVNDTQVNVGISSEYIGDKVILFMVDKVTNHGVN